VLVVTIKGEGEGQLNTIGSRERFLEVKDCCMILAELGVNGPTRLGVTVDGIPDQ
jgi:hypothetical protein